MMDVLYQVLDAGGNVVAGTDREDVARRVATSLGGSYVALATEADVEPAPAPATPHEEDRAEAAAVIAEAAAEAAEESAAEAVEVAAAVEEAVSAAEEAIPADAPPEVKAGMTEALEVIADLAEHEAGQAVEEAAIAESAAEIAADRGGEGDVEGAREAAAVAEGSADRAEQAAADVAPRRGRFAELWWG